MRFFCLLFSFSCACGITASAQNPNLVAPHDLRNKVERIELKVKSDLSFSGEPQQVNRATKPRVVRVSVRNIGPFPCNNFVVEVTYNWRIDNESFTAQSLKRAQTVSNLAAGQVLNLEFIVPDELIRRNAPFGTPNVNLSFRIDATNVISESAENNNTASFSLPILNP